MEICQIDITQAEQPVFIKISGPNGQQVEKFYVRTGNSSADLPLSEVHSYASDHFG